MAYRRRSSYRSSRARRPRPQLVWCRATVTVGPTAFGEDEHGMVDLLWRFRQPPTTFAADRLGNGQVSPAAAPDTAIAGTQPYAAAIVKRIRINIAEQTTITPSGLGGVYHGIFVGNSGLAAQNVVQDVTLQSFRHLSNALGQNSLDWLWWERENWYDSNLHVEGASAAFHRSYSIDTRCTRKLGDWGDTLLYMVEPDLGNGNVGYNARVSSSVLLALP